MTDVFVSVTQTNTVVGGEPAVKFVFETDFHGVSVASLVKNVITHILLNDTRLGRGIKHLEYPPGPEIYVWDPCEQTMRRRHMYPHTALVFCDPREAVAFKLIHCADGTLTVDPVWKAE